MPLKKASSGRSTILPIAVQSPHFAAQSLDFGSVVRGVATSRQFTLTNITNKALEVDLSANGVTVSPAHLSFQPAGMVGSTQGFTATLTSGIEGPFEDLLILSVVHDDVAVPGLENLRVTATVVPPPQLVLSVPEWGLSGVTSIDVGLMDDRPHYDGTPVPSFVVQVSNVGGAVAKNVRINPDGPGAVVPGGWGTCNHTQPSLCVSSTALGDIAPSASATATILIDGIGAVGEFLNAFHLQRDGAASVKVEVLGEVVPFALPDGKLFLRPVSASASGTPLANTAQSTGKFGEATDPLGSDSLAQLRVTSFDARSLFSVGDVDSVDLRAGNLTLVVPIGGEIPVRGPLSYSLQAVYNSDLWYRKSMGNFEIEVNGRYKAKPLDAEWANPLFNLRGGWALHLGRLLPPRVYQGTDYNSLCTTTDPFSFERVVDSGERFVYVDPSGTQHEFWRHLHGDEFPPGGDKKPQEDFGELYARDGSHLRLVRVNANERWVEEPGGIKRVFKFQSTRQPTLPDLWLLDRIEDRYGNQVKITYSDTQWTIGDREGSNGTTAWREVVVTFKTYTGRKSDEPMIVDKVELPGFDGGAKRTYTFNYGSVTLDRVRDSSFYANAKSFCPALDMSFQLPRLDSITGPEGIQWSFTYETTWNGLGDLHMTSVALPSGGSVDYRYEPIWDASSSCSGEGHSRIHSGVDQRTVKDVGGAVLERTSYLRQYRRDDIPAGICAAHRPDIENSIERPLSQQVVAVWKEQQNDLSTLTKHHFNIWPYNDRCPSGLPNCEDIDPGSGEDWRLASRRSFRDRNAPVNPADRDTEGLMLSTETYSCPWSFAGGPSSIGYVARSAIVEFSGDDIDDVTDFDGNGNNNAGGTCSKMTSSRKAIEVELGGTCTDGGLYCNRAWRVKSEKTLQHDDLDGDDPRWSRVDRSDYDGLGHYRRAIYDTSWGSSRTEFTNYNQSAGSLVLGAGYKVTSDITLPATWLLETYEDHWVSEGSTYRGGEARFHPTQGHLEFARTWRCASPGYLCGQAETSLSSTRTNTDLVVHYSVNADGEVTKEEHFGADTGFAVPTGNAWSSEAWPSASRDYAVETVYSYGLPQRRYVSGESVDEFERTIDQSTGWTKAEKLNSGETLSYAYDAAGRIRWITSGVTAGRRFTYSAPTATSGWKLDADVYLKSVAAGSTPPATSLIRSYTAGYDGLGRMVSETLPKESGTVVRTIGYHPSGKVKSVSSLDNTAKRSTFDYDYAGRQVLATRPDGSKRALRYVGARRVWDISCVDTGTLNPPETSGICPTTLEKAEAKVTYDSHGRIAETTHPTGIVTTFTYDPAGKMTSATRKQGATTQQRSWRYDGLGFQDKESIPERTDTTFSNFTTRGLPRVMNEGARSSTLAYDALGRLRSHVTGGVTVKQFGYCDSAAALANLCSTTGPENGQLIRATRRNQRAALYSGVFDDSTGIRLPVAGVWEVESDFGYDAAGRRDSRKTKVRWVPDQGTTTAWTSFNQGWEFDDVGNVTKRNYPTCVTPSNVTTAWGCADDSLAVTSSYAKGFYLTGVSAVGATSLGATLHYHASGLVSSVAHADATTHGTDFYDLPLNANDEVDGMARIGAMRLGVTGETTRLNLGKLSYDGAGNIRSIGSDTYQYDLDSRLTQAVASGQTDTYSYDRFDNITNNTDYPVDTETNRLLETATNGFAYDSFGNLTDVRIDARDVDIAYDELDKVISIYNDPEKPGARQLSIYDHDDLRIVQLEQPSGKVTWTLRDGLQVVRELVGIWNQIQTAKDYVYAGGRLISSRTYSGSYPAGAVSHYHTDQVGSSRLITGANTTQPRYEPFGKVIAASGEPIVGFQGHESDGAITYMRGRSYLPGGGRFLQVDPVRDGWNPYSSETNNPISRVDATGREDRPAMVPFTYRPSDEEQAMSDFVNAMAPAENLASSMLRPQDCGKCETLRAPSVGHDGTGVVGDIFIALTAPEETLEITPNLTPEQKEDARAARTLIRAGMSATAALSATSSVSSIRGASATRTKTILNSSEAQRAAVQTAGPSVTPSPAFYVTKKGGYYIKTETGTRRRFISTEEAVRRFQDGQRVLTKDGTCVGNCDQPASE